MTPNAAFDVEVNENISKNQDIVGIKIPIISKQQLGEKQHMVKIKQVQ